MIKARVLKDSTLTALSGSIVYVSECQFKALGDNVVIVTDEGNTQLLTGSTKDTTNNKAEESEEPKPAKRTTKKK